jgi:hypothetical protein
VLVADSDRDRVVLALRDQYVRGVLTLEEFSHRTGLALAARSRHDLRRAVSGLPVLAELDDLVRRGRAFAGAALRRAALVLLTGTYLLFTLILLLVLAGVALAHGASGATLIGFLVVWLVPTVLLLRSWRRTRPRRRPRSRAAYGRTRGVRL